MAKKDEIEQDVLDGIQDAIRTVDMQLAAMSVLKGLLTREDVWFERPSIVQKIHGYVSLPHTPQNVKGEKADIVELACDLAEQLVVTMKERTTI